MNYLNALILGIVQGFTEFLPVSSSGHLVIAQQILPDLGTPGVVFEVVLHFGTTLAVIFYFWKTITNITFQKIKFLAIASIPVGLVGFFFQDLIESFFIGTKVVGIGLLLTAFFNFFTDILKPEKFKIDLPRALNIGIFQSLALMPGVSRSGSTIFGGIVAGIDKREAAEFSFLLSIPAILGANVLQIYKYGSLALNGNLMIYMIGFFASLIAGFVAIKLTMKLLVSQKFTIFAVYTLLLAIVTLILA